MGRPAILFTDGGRNMNIFKTLFFAFMMLSGVAISLNSSQAQENSRSDKIAHVMEVKGPISPAVTDYFQREFTKATDENAGFIIVKMHTPGGLVTSMQDIIQMILASDIPVITYVSPSGSHAASAGTYILYASHIAAMAPATNIGAATPVQMGGNDKNSPEETENETSEAPKTNSKALELKSVNDAVAYIRELAVLRGRNADWAEKAVRDAVSLGAQEALKENIIDVVAKDLDDLMTQINGRTIDLNGKKTELDTENIEFVDVKPDIRTQILMIISNPNIAFFLMTLGFYGLIYEFANPGAFVPGIVGFICLAVALFALNVLPVNYTGVVLLLFGVALMSAEAFVPSFGVLGIAGAIAFALGGTILIDTDILGFGISWEVIALVTGLSLLVLVVVLSMATRAHKRKVTTGEEALIGSEATVLEWHGSHGEVKTWGERWAAKSNTPMSLKTNDIVYVVEKEKLTLTVSNIKPIIKGE